MNNETNSPFSGYPFSHVLPSNIFTNMFKQKEGKIFKKYGKLLKDPKPKSKVNQTQNANTNKSRKGNRTFDINENFDSLLTQTKSYKQSNTTLKSITNFYNTIDIDINQTLNILNKQQHLKCISNELIDLTQNKKQNAVIINNTHNNSNSNDINNNKNELNMNINDIIPNKNRNEKMKQKNNCKYIYKINHSVNTEPSQSGESSTTNKHFIYEKTRIKPLTRLHKKDIKIPHHISIKKIDIASAINNQNNNSNINNADNGNNNNNSITESKYTSTCLTNRNRNTPQCLEDTDIKDDISIIKKTDNGQCNENQQNEIKTVCLYKTPTMDTRTIKLSNKMLIRRNSTSTSNKVLFKLKQKIQEIIIKYKAKTNQGKTTNDNNNTNNDLNSLLNELSNLIDLY